MITDLANWVNKLASIRDDALQKELQKLHSEFEISEDKFIQALSFYSCSDAVARIDLQTLRSLLNIPSDVSNSDLDGNRWRSAFIHRAYATFVYMRSEHLEKRLDYVKDNSPIRPFRDFFRSGSIKYGTDTVAQHIRNSLCHGSFTITRDLKYVEFVDYDWKAKVGCDLFYNKLCDEIKRFYLRAFEAQNGLQK